MGEGTIWIPGEAEQKAPGCGALHTLRENRLRIGNRMQLEWEELRVERVWEKDRGPAVAWLWRGRRGRRRLRERERRGKREQRRIGDRDFPKFLAA